MKKQLILPLLIGSFLFVNAQAGIMDNIKHNFTNHKLKTSLLSMVALGSAGLGAYLLSKYGNPFSEQNMQDPERSRFLAFVSIGLPIGLLGKLLGNSMAKCPCKKPNQKNS